MALDLAGVAVGALVVAVPTVIHLINYFNRRPERPVRVDDSITEHFRDQVPAPSYGQAEKLDLDSENYYNICITGRSGVGKSTLINSLRGLMADDPEAAAVNEDECTANDKMTKYPHPKAKNLMLWDCPGSDTQEPRATYSHDNFLVGFDFLIVVFTDRFGEAEIDPMKQATAHKVPFACVRNKVNHDFESRRRKNQAFKKLPQEEAVDQLVQDLRSNTTKCLKKAGISTEPPIFIINAWALVSEEEVKFEELKLFEYVLRESYNRRNEKSIRVN